jgi:hypothetical protein
MRGVEEYMRIRKESNIFNPANQQNLNKNKDEKRYLNQQ